MEYLQITDFTKLYDYYNKIKAPYYFDVDYTLWLESFNRDTDYDNQPMFKELFTYAAICDGCIVGFIQFGRSNYVYDKRGEKDYQFIEIMGCPGGCVTGGGTPIVDATTLSYIDLKAERAKALYSEDAGKAKRKSHENEEVKTLYKEFLGEPNSHKAHELLHTHYIPRPKYIKK